MLQLLVVELGFLALLVFLRSTLIQIIKLFRFLMDVAFKEGDLITIDGTLGQVLGGTPKMIEAALDDSLKLMLEWAEEAGDIKVRANADTPSEAKTAQNFNAHGIGLCRTEHMFFER